MFLSIKPTIHPYAGIIQIRLEGIISAHTCGHPLIIWLQRYVLLSK